MGVGTRLTVNIAAGQRNHGRPCIAVERFQIIKKQTKMCTYMEEIMNNNRSPIKFNFYPTLDTMNHVFELSYRRMDI